MTSVSIVIPVGPSPDACAYLDEAVTSLHSQTHQSFEVVAVDDMHEIGGHIGCRMLAYDLDTCYRTRWRTGVPGAFNIGISVASNDLIIMLGADDWLEPEAVERLVETYEANNRKDAYYSFSIRYSDTGEIQDRPLPERRARRRVSFSMATIVS